MENTQIEIVKTQVSKALETVQSITVATKTEYEQAVEIGGKLKKVFKMVTERKEEITKPMNEALKSARSLFKPMEETLEQAEKELKDKMLVFMQEERKKEAEAQKKAEEEIKKQEELLAKKEITRDEASKATVLANTEAKMAEVQKTVKTESGAKATEKFVLEYIIEDKTKIPLNFLEPDMVKIKASFKAGMPVGGVVEQKKAIISF
jgi:hypothetical protein